MPDKSPAFQTASTAFLAAINSPESAELNALEVKSLMEAIPAEEKMDFRKFMLTTTVTRLKDIMYYGIDPDTDSAELQHAKRVFKDDVEGEGEGMDDDAKTALLNSLPNQTDKARFLIHVMTASA